MTRIPRPQQALFGALFLTLSLVLSVHEEPHITFLRAVTGFAVPATARADSGGTFGGIAGIRG